MRSLLPTDDRIVLAFPIQFQVIGIFQAAVDIQDYDDSTSSNSNESSVGSVDGKDASFKVCHMNVNTHKPPLRPFQAALSSIPFHYY